MSTAPQPRIYTDGWCSYGECAVYLHSRGACVMEALTINGRRAAAMAAQ
jgi:CO dehydrogenase/acetyl-CoA synthase alpha subunit